MADRVALRQVDVALILRIFLPSAAGHNVTLIVENKDQVAKVIKALYLIEQILPGVQHGEAGTLVTYPPFREAASGHIAMLTLAQEEALQRIRDERAATLKDEAAREAFDLVRALSEQLKGFSRPALQEKLLMVST